MKILILYPTVFPDFIGGVEHRNYELGAALARRGHEVTLAGFCRPQEGVPPRLAVRSLGPLQGLYNEDGQRSTLQALRFASVAARLDLTPYDVIETASVPYAHLLPLAFRCHLAGKPLIVTWYEYWGDYWKRYVGRLKAPAYAFVEWFTAQLGGAVTATSRLTAERLTARRGRGGVELIPCGIRLSEVQREARLGEHRHGEGAPLLYAGRLLREKRIDLLLRAVALLAQRKAGSRPVGGRPQPVQGTASIPPTAPIPPTSAPPASSAPSSRDAPARPLLTVFGEGPARSELEALASELGIADRVEFRGHVASISEVWEELGRAKVAVQPSEREGFGLFPLEAMASGVPVVYCDSPESAVPELVRDGLDGICAAPTPQGLAQALERLLRDDTEWRRMQANALQRAAEYDWDSIAAQIERTCLRLVR